MTGLRIVALDLALEETGIGEHDDLGTRTFHLKAPGRGHERMDWNLNRISQAIDGADIVAVEGPSYGSHSGSQRGHHERAGLWWLVTHSLLRASEIPYVVIPPANNKMYATGKGNASKAAMLIAATRRFPDVDIHADDNEADALWLLAATADHYGYPLVTMPQAHRAALATVPGWPVLSALGVAS
jgi:crossover junction endodeoxyribonuclease RuvC